MSTSRPGPASSGRSIAAVLADAQSRLCRLSPAQAYEASRSGALLVDIRPVADRADEGEIPGSLVLERNVLEWRLDPLSDTWIAQAAYDLVAVVVCNEGYASSLAAVALHNVGVHQATDLIGGYRAWRAAGLPTVPGGTPAGTECHPPVRPMLPANRLTLLNLSLPSPQAGLTAPRSASLPTGARPTTI